MVTECTNTNNQMITKKDYEDLKEYWDYQRKVQFNKEIVHNMAEQVENTGPPIPAPTRQPVTLNPDLYPQYVGQYQIGPEFLIVVSQEGEQLMVQTANEKKVELLPKSETDFFFKDVDAQIEFMKGSSGQVTGLLLYHQKQKLFGEKVQ